MCLTGGCGPGAPQTPEEALDVEVYVLAQVADRHVAIHDATGVDGLLISVATPRPASLDEMSRGPARAITIANANAWPVAHDSRGGRRERSLAPSRRPRHPKGS